jgi:hypothetical protein
MYRGFMLAQKGLVNEALLVLSPALEEATNTIAIRISNQTKRRLALFLPGQTTRCGFGNLQDLPRAQIIAGAGHQP